MATPGLIGAPVGFEHEMRTRPPPGISAIPFGPEAPASVLPESEALFVTPGNTGAAPITVPVAVIEHVTPCALAGLASVNRRVKNIEGTNKRLITRILL